MKIKTIVQHLWVSEGKRIKVSIANMREIVGLLSDMMLKPGGADVMQALIKNGQRRAAKKKK
jgi:hypothetical protein